MTREKLLRANELRDTIDRLFKRKKELEKMQGLCREDADIAKRTLHSYCLQARPLNGGYNKEVNVSTMGALQAVNRDIEDIEREVRKLGEEFDEL